MIKELVCINCPNSCNLSVEVNEHNEILSVSGNKCPRGDAYARKELTHPTRIITSTVRITNAIHGVLPVITSADIPKEKMFDVMKEIQKVEVCAPIENGAIIVKDVCGLGVDVIASRSMEKIN